MALFELLVVEGFRILLAVLLAVIAQYFALKVFDRLTPGMSNLKEVRQGNAAVGILVGAVILSVAIIVAEQLETVIIPLQPGEWLEFATDYASLLLAVGFTIVVQAMAYWLMARILRRGFNTTAEIKRGNVAVALLYGALLYSVTITIQAGLPKA